MRTTLSIADDILRDLKALASKRGISLTKVANDILRAGLARGVDPKRRRYREEIVDLGEPILDLVRALEIAERLEDDETVRKLELRK